MEVQFLGLRGDDATMFLAQIFEVRFPCSRMGDYINLGYPSQLRYTDAYSLLCVQCHDRFQKLSQRIFVKLCQRSGGLPAVSYVRSVILEYEVILGVGSSGVVYSGRLKGKRVAIKLPHLRKLSNQVRHRVSSYNTYRSEHFVFVRPF